MTLYTKKAGQYTELTTDQLRILRRTSEVIALQVTSKHLATRVRALAAWMEGVQQRAFDEKCVLKLNPADLAVTRLPNSCSLLALADEVDKRERALHNV